MNLPGQILQAPHGAQEHLVFHVMCRWDIHHGEHDNFSVEICVGDNCVGAVDLAETVQNL